MNMNTRIEKKASTTVDRVINVWAPYSPTTQEFLQVLQQPQTEGIVDYAVRALLKKANAYEHLIAEIYAQRQHLSPELLKNVENVLGMSIEKSVQCTDLKKRVGDFFAEAVRALVAHKEYITLEQRFMLKNTTRFSDAAQREVEKFF